MTVKKQTEEKKCGREGCDNTVQTTGKKKYCSKKCAKIMQQQQLKKLAEYRKTCPHCHKPIVPMSGKYRKYKPEEDMPKERTQPDSTSPILTQ